jgi:23S rRNA pseudouridine2605 synthase
MAGVAARRKADELIAAGRVRVNGATPPPGGVMVVPGRDQVEVDGAAVVPAAGHRYAAVNKPAGYLSAVSDSSRRPLVTSLLPAGLRDEARGRQPLHPVGRLDLRSRGLIILTDDGELSFRLQHPRHHVEKEYLVRVDRKPVAKDLDRLRRGVRLEEGTTAPAEVQVMPLTGPGGGPPGRKAPATLKIVLRQGWKREIRRSLDTLGYRVIDLLRVRIGPLQLGDLPEGRGRELTVGEVAELRASVGL